MPRRALGISIASLLGPVVIVAVAPDWASNGLGMLIWLSALIPAFLLSYYRGLAGVALALAGGMAVITATQVGVVVFAVAEPDWRILGAVVGIYLAISLGIAILAEVLRRERQSAESMALVDALTRLPNRRHAELVLQSEFAGAERGSGLAVVLFDLDRFKRVNDRHGHPAGDATLRVFAKILAENTRQENISARFGGEEFIAVLRNASGDAATAFAQRVLDAMRRYPLPWGVQTVSAGVATYEKGMGTFELLVSAADRALYKAKSGGRDMVCVAPAAAETVATPPKRVSTSQMRRLSDSDLSAAVSAADVAQDAQAPLVYIVDDDAAIRSILKRILSRRGFRLWDSGDPREAIARFAAASADDRPDVILTDVMMPVMTGMRMIDEIAHIEPSLHVIYMSGFVQSKIDWPGTPGAVVAFLPKPIDPKTLVAAVEAIIKEGAAA